MSFGMKTFEKLIFIRHLPGMFLDRGCGTNTLIYRQSSDNCVFGFHISAPGKSPNTVSMI